MDQQLGSVLAVLMARTGAEAGRVVDARGGAVLAQVGVIPADDVTALVALARDVAPGSDDLVLPTREGVHLLRSLSVAFVHLRVAAGPGVAAARRELASPELRRAIDGASEAVARSAAGRGSPQVPEPHPEPDGPPGRHSRAGRPARQPALAALGSAAVRADRAGPLAVLALAPGPDGPTPATRHRVALPQRAVVSAARPLGAVSRPLALPAVLKQEWAGDAATMGRILEGLRRLN